MSGWKPTISLICPPPNNAFVYLWKGWPLCERLTPVWKVDPCVTPVCYYQKQTQSNKIKRTTTGADIVYRTSVSHSYDAPLAQLLFVVGPHSLSYVFSLGNQYAVYQSSQVFVLSVTSVRSIPVTFSSLSHFVVVLNHFCRIALHICLSHCVTFVRQKAP